MPFDDKGFLKDDALTFSPGKEGLRKLAILLRRVLPDRFTWDYGTVHEELDCGTVGCAMGLARVVWPEAKAALPVFCHGQATDSGSVQRLFGIPWHVADAIFFWGTACNKPRQEIKPGDVAAAIDRYLATGKVS